MSDWQTASERLNSFVRLDHELGEKLMELTKAQARDTKLANAIEAGRIYGLQQQFYEMKLQRQLGKKLHGLTEDSW